MIYFSTFDLNSLGGLLPNKCCTKQLRKTQLFRNQRVCLAQQPTGAGRHGGHGFSQPSTFQRLPEAGASVVGGGLLVGVLKVRLVAYK